MKEKFYKIAQFGVLTDSLSKQQRTVLTCPQDNLGFLFYPAIGISVLIGIIAILNIETKRRFINKIKIILREGWIILVSLLLSMICNFIIDSLSRCAGCCYHKKAELFGWFVLIYIILRFFIWVVSIAKIRRR